MRQSWRRWVDCSDAFGRMRQVLVLLTDEDGLAVRLPGTGETVYLHRHQAEQLRRAVADGMARAGDRARSGRGS